MELNAKKIGLFLLAVFLIGILILGVLGVLVIGNLLAGSDAPQGNVAVIEVNGPIVGGGGGGTPWQAAQANAREIMDYINQAKENQNIKAILLRVNSPGGSSAASDAIYRELKKFKQTGRPVIASMGDMAASGGYYVSCLADKIYANPATITGSIGVIMKFQNREGLYDKLGINNVTLKSGKYKDIGSATRTMSDKEKELLKQMINEVYNRFVDVVAEGREMSKEEVKELADGRIYNGEQAKKIKLVDKLGTYYDALDAAAKLADIKGEPNLVHYGRPSPLERLLSSANRLVLSLLRGAETNSTTLKSGDFKTDFLYYQLLRDGKSRRLKLEY